MKDYFKKANIQRQLGIVLLFACLSFAYLYPGSAAMMSGRTDIVLGDDTDSSAAPYHFGIILEVWKHNPSHLLYGSVYYEGGNPDGGMSLWYTWFERFAVIFLSYLVPMEQVSVAFSFLVFMLNALSMYALSRTLNWNRSLAVGLSMAWAFCGYTRARAKVHMGLAGTFFLPLIFLGLVSLARGKSWKSLLLASSLFLFAVMGSQYFIVMSAFLSPLFALFYYLQPEVRQNLKQSLLRLLLAIIPAVSFLGFSRLYPIPPDAKMSVEAALPKTGETKSGEIHPFLLAFSARPIDYFAGDVGIGPTDINPLKGMINRYILTNLDNSNPHERSNGIRWLFWVLAIWIGYLLWTKKFPEDPQVRPIILFFFGFAAVAFWLSMSPNFPGPKAGLSYFLYSLVPQIRVPSRASVFVHFSLLMIAGYSLTLLLEKSKLRKKESFHLPKAVAWILRPAILPVLVFVELPPFVQSMPMAPMRPAYSELMREKGPCGAGMYFPYVGSNWGLGEYYHFMQQMRGSDCLLINNVENAEFKEWMVRRFPVHEKFFEALQQNNPAIASAFEQIVRCTPLTWLVFDPRTPEAWRNSFCARLGWKMNPDLSCIAPDKGQAFVKLPNQCI